MWNLTVRGERGSPFAELGDFASLTEAAQAIVETEADPSLGAIFFRVYVDPLDGNSDATVLSRLEYQSCKRFYLLTRQRN